MPELQTEQAASPGAYGRLTSPYLRQTQSEIEMDCNCADILNILERHDLQNEVLDRSRLSQRLS